MDSAASSETPNKKAKVAATKKGKKAAPLNATPDKKDTETPQPAATAKGAKASSTKAKAAANKLGAAKKLPTKPVKGQKKAVKASRKLRKR